MEWIKVDLQIKELPKFPCLLCDEYENVYVGDCARDFYDAVYWFPLPRFPFPRQGFASDEAAIAVLNHKK